MEPITSNDFLNSVLEAEAWKEVSQSGSLSMTMIEKFADKLDWEEVSGNRNIIWTVDGINKFANRIHWDEFSRSCPENILSESTLQKFASKWDWKALSNRDICEALPLSRGLVSFSESGRPITTAHPYFLLFYTAKLDSPDAAYLRSQKKLHKFFHSKKTIVLDTSEIISKFASNTNLLKMGIVKLNRIRAVLAESDKQGNGWLNNLAKILQRSHSGEPIPYSLI